MISVNECDRYADRVDDAILNIIQILNKYEESLSFVKQNKSKDSEIIARSLEDEIANLNSEKRRLSKVAETIRSKARQIYNEELEEERRRQEEEAARNSAEGVNNYSNN